MSKRKTKDGNKPWERTRASQVRPVAIDVLETRQSFLIVCEGAQTEKNYFLRFRANSRVEDFVVQGLGANTRSLVQQAIGIRTREESKRGANFDQAWCVFDRDSFPAQDFNEAIRLAIQHGFQVAYTNEAFELWYLLHFDLHESAYSRQQYGQMLTERLETPYQKNSARTYELLQEKGSEEAAIKRADRLLNSHWEQNDRINPQGDNPSTTVHCLVQELRKHSANQRGQARSNRNMCQEVFDALKTMTQPRESTDETK